MEISQKLIDFTQDHSFEDVAMFRLKFSGKNSQKFDFDLNFALLQIEARQKTRKKLPGFLTYPEFVFPTLLSAEQASNEAVANFHASLVSSSASLLDLTAGLGIDDLSFAKIGISVTACEIDSNKCEALDHNAKVLGLHDRISVINTESIDYLRNLNTRFDVVFADPARRNDSGGKLHALSDCQPDILSGMNDIMSVTDRLLVKCSPLLDLTFIRDSVSELHQIFVVCFRGECKEVLIDIQKDKYFNGVTVIDLDWNRQISRFHTPLSGSDSLNRSSYCDRKYASQYRFLYEPNPGVMKTGAWTSLISEFPTLFKADTNTHLFLSDTLYEEFPGRVMQIISEPDKKALKALKGENINVVSRNHPLSAPQIGKKYSLIPGGDKFLYAFRYRSEPTIIEARNFIVSQ